MTTGPDLVEGDRVELTVGAPAHGGHCVARLGGEHGRVVFVRHALPGERVTAEITEVHKGFLRADAVTIHEASPDRVEPPCPYARPGACGGCDLQHASGEAQRQWKKAVVEEQLRRLAGLSWDVRVEELPNEAGRTGPDSSGLLGWRSRVRYAVDAADRAGLLKHRSHEVVAIDRCRIAHPAIQALDVLKLEWPGTDAVAAVATTGGDVAVLSRPASGGGVLPPDDPADGTALGNNGQVRVSGPEEVTEVAAGRRWQLPPDGFWQVHPAAAQTLAAAVVELLQPAEGEVTWDLYGGAGLFAGAVAERTHGRTTVVESSRAGVVSARRNLADLPSAEVVEARVEAALSRRRVTGPVDLVVLDPPRAGAGAKVVRSVAEAGPRAVAYVSCDPASLARDIATFQGLGWKLTTLRAFDCFPMTQHIECVALLEPAPESAVEPTSEPAS
ncbi:class I SAM-dependent RNA methyltransferase [Paractinoplanes maris]|uniref:class I SAM-dependent RNA methyltransferase n=1 Tax=Paractinoplanes maris TaxID=1734446 RepID=UPI0020213AFE|nr:TRAM domain-containing protein [Actinoplanes maris]